MSLDGEGPVVTTWAGRGRARSPSREHRRTAHPIRWRTGAQCDKQTPAVRSPDLCDLTAKAFMNPPVKALSRRVPMPVECKRETPGLGIRGGTRPRHPSEPWIIRRDATNPECSTLRAAPEMGDEQRQTSPGHRAKRTVRLALHGISSATPRLPCTVLTRSSGPGETLVGKGSGSRTPAWPPGTDRPSLPLT